MALRMEHNLHSTAQRPRDRTNHVLLWLTALAFLLGLATLASCDELTEHPVRQTMLGVHNVLRRSQGQPDQRLDEQLCLAAQRHADWLAATEYHRTPGGPSMHVGASGSTVQDRAQAVGFVAWRSLSENAASGYRGVPQVFVGWKGSPGHWANILRPGDLCGFGYQVSARGATYWVALYAQSADARK